MEQRSARGDVDVLVVGAGPAGVACASAAAAGGASVVLLEKADDVGGTLHLSGGHLSAAGTRQQRALGIDDSPERHAADVARISRGTARADLVRLAVEGAAATVERLEEHGLVAARGTPRIVYGHEPYSVPRTHHGPELGRSVLVAVRSLLRGALQTGRVELRLGTRVEALRRGVAGSGTADGACSGAVLAGGDVVTARATVLCTGGFGADPVLFGELEGGPLVSAAMPTSTGDGLRMARALGAAVAGRGCYLPTFGGLPPPDGTRVRWDDRPLLVAAERPPWEIYVDRAGRRFVAEDEPSVDVKERALAGVPDRTFWTVFDAAALAASRPMVVGWSPDELRSRCGRQPGVHAATTLPELAGVAGIDPAGLASTVAGYNAGVAAEADPEFGRAHLPAPIAVPPFYALRNHGVTLITFSGVDVDGDLRVRRADGRPIAGLYAAGEVIGAAATSGNSFCGGMVLTPALTFGHLLGGRLAADR